jgi:ferredoxin-type protein NapG
MKRRDFLRSLIAVPLTILIGALPFGVASLLSPRRPVAKLNNMRPPGAPKDDAAFIAACIECGLCGEICPPRAILFHARDSAAGADTPYVDPEQKGCILCGKCMEVCPTEALSIIPRDKIDMGIAEIDRTACYPWVDRGICGACVSICPVGGKAIGFKMWNQYRPIIRSGCVGCGMCVEACPHPSLPIWIVDRPQQSAAKGRA